MKIQSDLEGKVNIIQSLFETSQKQSFSSNGKELLSKYISSPLYNKPQKVNGESTLEKLLKKRKVSKILILFVSDVLLSITRRILKFCT